MDERICTIVGLGPGLSSAVARRFGRSGFTIAALARRPEPLAATVDQLRAEGLSAHGFVADAGDPDSLSTALLRLHVELGPTDVLVYNAAQLTAAEPMALSPSALGEQLAINVGGALCAAQCVAPAMQQRGAGTILITGGSLALRPWSAFCGLSVSKAALRSLGQCLAQQLGPLGIHVAQVMICGLIAPGTDFDPDEIARLYFELHCEPRERWRAEVAYRGPGSASALPIPPLVLPPLQQA